MLTQIQKEFLSNFGEDIEISNLKEIVEPNENENIYFLAGVSNKKKRNNDNDIKYTNHFFMDFDIRNFIRENENNEISDNEIIEIGEKLSIFLNENPKYGFNQWRYIIYTGNGIHLYYIGDTLEVGKDITPREYQAGVKKIYQCFSEWIGSDYLNPDMSCRNIGRVARLPDTINQKNGQRVKIIAEQKVKSVLVSKIPQYGKKQIELENQYQELLARKYFLLAKEDMLNGKDRTLMERILQYPVETILINSNKIPIGGFVNNKNFIDPRDKSYYGFYKANDGNYIVVGGSTTLAPYADGHDGLNPFHLVQGLYNLDNAGVYSFFEKLGKN